MQAKKKQTKNCNQQRKCKQNVEDSKDGVLEWRYNGILELISIWEDIEIQIIHEAPTITVQLTITLQSCISPYTPLPLLHRKA